MCIQQFNWMKASIMLLLIPLMALAPMVTQAQSTTLTHAELVEEIDQMLAATYPADGPGAAVLVMRDDEIILRKGYGLANVELGVPIAPEMVFRLGSVAKQFTAMAILMLSEEGKVALDDDIIQYLPYYPTHGATITLENLLTHTSGVKDFELLPARLTVAHDDLTVEQMIDLFKDEPPDFAPGEAWSYSNSGYVLLGAIIEKVSGMRYADFIQERIFTPLGMTHSYYDDPTQLIPGRAAGYTQTADGFQNAEYMSMSHAYAAGALASSVDDLARWDAALYSDQLVSQATLRRAFTSYVFPNGARKGDAAGYGYGWVVEHYAGDTIYEHTGGINGFNAAVLRLPAAHLYVAILSNREEYSNTVGNLVFNIATLLIGKPYHDPATVSVPTATLDTYEGVYQWETKSEIVVRRADDHLVVEPAEGPSLEVTPMSSTTFFLKGSYLRLRFVKTRAGEVTELRVQQHFGGWVVAPKLDKPLPPPVESVEVDPAILAEYAGEYEAADFTLMITLEDGKLMVEPTDAEKTELVPTAATEFEMPALGAQIVFVRDADGAVTGLVVKLGGQEIEAAKVTTQTQGN